MTALRRGHPEERGDEGSPTNVGYELAHTPYLEK